MIKTFPKKLTIVLLISLMISLTVNLRGYFVVEDLMEGNTELILRSYNTNIKLQELIKSKRIYEAAVVLNKEIKYQEYLLTRTALSKISTKAEKEMKE